MGHNGSVTPVYASVSVLRVTDVVAKVLQECQNGLASREITIPLPDRDRPDRGEGVAFVDDIREQVQGYARSIDARVRQAPGALRIVVPRATVSVVFTGAAIVVRGRRRPGPAPSAGTDPARALARSPVLRLDTPTTSGGGDVWCAAIELATLGARPLTADGLARLRRLLDSDTRVLATMAADLLNRAGQPAVPGFVRGLGRLGAPAAAPDDAAFTEHWEARISVDEYALFEALHPAYAAQVIALATMAYRYAEQVPTTVLDVGSGPGLPTVMFMELLPGLAVDAVEPSPTAFQYLRDNVDGRAVVAHNSGIAEYPGECRYPLVVSVGVSHHMDTRVFLRSLHRLAQPGGLILVADELISSFRTEEERTRNLIAHHMTYVDEALTHLVEADLPLEERRRLRAFRALDRSAPEAFRKLLDEARQTRVSHPDDLSGWERVRFAVLELEALVAGIDYDVERKTCPANFLALAGDEGLEVLDHERVYATVGDSPLDAGTHAFALRRPA